MRVTTLISRRYLVGRKTFTFINIISLLATLGITFGVAALIVVMSVFNGFNGLVTDILQNFDPHIKVERLPRTRSAAVGRATGRTLRDAEVDSVIRARDDVRGVAPFISRKAMAMSRDNNVFVWVKGMDADVIDGVSGVRSTIVLGAFDVGKSRGVVLGRHLADEMRVLVGDSITLVSPAGMENVLTQYVMPTALRCPVVGIFDSKNKLYDGSYAFISLGDARLLFRMPEDVTGYELRLSSIDRSARAKAELEEAVGAGWTVLTWEDLHKDLYAMMTIERWSAFILLSIIIAVAVFNILASLTMLVVEKKRDIGILRTMGMPAAAIRRVFLLQGFWIGLTGTVAGMVLGLVVTWLQAEFGLVRLDAAFIIPAIPVDVRWSDIVLIVVATFGLCLAASWYPAERARRVEIIDAIRWE